jgi:hypothetical protein
MPDRAQFEYEKPVARQLQIFSLDPAADVSMDTATISRCVIDIPWEELKPGPVGEYLEVVDLDPSSGCGYRPVNLMDPRLLATNGLPPSTGNPQFHQQMVYAVVMKTIQNFERVLGRDIQWSERLLDDNGKFIRDPDQRYVGRLRIYPHALREQNAYYSPTKKALLFGYFNATTADPRDELPGGLVFTCLSHDIIAHETTHAIIDGLHRRLIDDTNPDMLAFHEAFADIVAIFQHFCLPGVLLDQIQRTRGDLRIDNLLVRLASQFARATGSGGALRNALGDRGPEGRQLPPDPGKLARTSNPHERGAIFVAAIFDSFLRIYENRIKDLRRIATGGTGILPQGDIHPDLAGRLAQEASRASRHVLNICIRALDYVPPVDLTFGDFLRSLITADAEFYPEDQRLYRLAFIESFRERGIYPNDLRTLSQDSLLWRPMDAATWAKLQDVLPPPQVLRTMAHAYGCEDEQMIERLRRLNDDLIRDWRAKRASKKVSGRTPVLDDFDSLADRFLERCWIGIQARQEEGHGGKATSSSSRSAETDRSEPAPANSTDNDKAEAGTGCESSGELRYHRYLLEREFARFLHYWIVQRALWIAENYSGQEMEDRLDDIGRYLGLDLRAAIENYQHPYKMRLEVHSVRPTIRLRAEGGTKVELLVHVTQSNRRNLPAWSNGTAETDERIPPVESADGRPLEYKFRGGSTLLIDPEKGAVRYAISKNLLSERRRSAHEAFLLERVSKLGADAIDRYRLRPHKENEDDHDVTLRSPPVEPFALAHREVDTGDEAYG